MTENSERPDVRVGDVWKCLESEDKYGRDRRVRVTEVSEDKVRGEGTSGGRKTTVSRARMFPNKLGWRLVERDGKPVDDHVG